MSVVSYFSVDSNGIFNIIQAAIELRYIAVLRRVSGRRNVLTSLSL